MPDENIGPVRKKTKFGLIGLILSILGYLGFGILTLLPASIFCVIALFRKSSRILAIIGLLLCSFWIAYLVKPDLPFPNPYGVTKFAYNFNADFWVGFDPGNIKNARAEYWFFGGSGGAMYFHSESATYNSEDVIEYAKIHGWEYEGRDTVSVADFNKLIDAKNKVRYLDINDYYKPTSDYDVNDQESVMEIYDYELKKARILQNASMGAFPLWIRSDCHVLFFDTNNRIGNLSSVFISNDGKSLSVYYDGVR